MINLTDGKTYLYPDIKVLGYMGNVILKLTFSLDEEEHHVDCIKSSLNHPGWLGIEKDWNQTRHTREVTIYFKDEGDLEIKITILKGKLKECTEFALEQVKVRGERRKKEDNIDNLVSKLLKGGK